MSPADGEVPRISVLVPVVEATEELEVVHRETANEIARLGETAEYLYLVASQAPELIARLRSLQRDDPKSVRVIQVGQNVGGAALLTAGVAAARGEILFTRPPCYEVEPGALTDLHEAIRKGADLAFARRGGRVRHAPRIQSRVFNKLIAWAAGTTFTDVTTDTRAIRREVLKEVPLYGEFHRYLPVLADRVGFCVREVAAREHARARSYRYAPTDYLWRALDVLSLFFLSRFTRRPLRLFGGLGSLFGLIGGGILVVVAVQRLFLSRALADRPILVLGTLLFGLGVQLFTIGLLGELILFFHARNLRDYRIAAVYEGAPTPPPPEGAARSQPDGREPGAAQPQTSASHSSSVRAS